MAVRPGTRSDTGLARLVIALFILVIALVAVVFIVMLVSVVGLRSDVEGGKRSTNLLTAATAAEISLLDVETGLRGFLLTHENKFLTPYRQANALIGGQLAAMSQYAASTDDKQRVAELSSAIDRYLADYARPLIAAARHPSRAQVINLTARGERLVDAMRSQFTALVAAELAERQARRNSLASQTSRTVAIAAVGLAVSVLLLVALGAYLVRSILRPTRRVADAAERLAAGDLSVRVPEQGRGEVIRLGRSFNAMAGALETRNAELLEANRQLEHAVEVAEEASRMKSNFLANMSHEIRTPLNGVVGMVDLLSTTDLSSEQCEYVDTARASSEMLMTVVNDILDVSKIEAGRLELEHRDFDLHELIDVGCAMLGAEASAKGVDLRVSIADDVPRAVHGDRLRVGQILANLVSNAVKFTAAGEVAVDVALTGHRNGATDVRFEVRDTGIGISSERVGRLFDPFTQAEAGTSRRFGGTGLGLTISRDLVGLMGGTIEAESELGRGSTFRFTLPLAPALDELEPPAPPVELRGLRVLVTDDNAASRRILEAYAASWGMRPTPAHDAAAAFDQLLRAVDAGEPFEVALLDLNMPGESGLELARRITDAPRLRGTRLIMLASSEVSTDELESNGIRQRLSKPVRQSSLLEAITHSMRSGLRVRAGAVSDAPAPEPARPAPARAATTPAVSAQAASPPAVSAQAASPPAVSAQAASPPAASPEATPPRPGHRILVAEDNATNRLYVDRLLTRNGHSVALAADGREVLRMYGAHAYDLILMDCQMPELDGYDATREIRRREEHAGGAHIPIVAMTAGALDGAREQCLQAGMDDYVAKPFARDDLEQVIARWLPEPAAVLDPARMAEIGDLFPGGEAGAMLGELAATIENDLAAIGAALAAADAAAIGAAAHRIAGSAQLIGATALIEAASELERHARDCAAAARQVDPPAVSLLRRRWMVTLGAIDAELARLQSSPVDP